MSRRKTFEEFISEYLEIRGELKYYFDESTYKDMHTPMRIVCPKHGEFWRMPKTMKRYNCQKCAREEVGRICRLTNEKFIEKAKRVHGNKYDYSKVEYLASKINVKIICPIHGEFEQKPNDHLSGKGCPICNESHLERGVKKFLNGKGIEYIYQYRIDWLGRQSLDFYIPSLNMGIECQGKQHFGKGGWSDDYDFNKVYELDSRKRKLCNEKDVDIVYVIDNNMNYSIPEAIEYRRDIIRLKDLEKVYIEKCNKKK